MFLNMNSTSVKAHLQQKKGNSQQHLKVQSEHIPLYNVTESLNHISNMPIILRDFLNLSYSMCTFFLKACLFDTFFVF